MKVERRFKPVGLAIGGFLMALGAGVGTQIADFLPLYTLFFEWIGVLLFGVGAVLSFVSMVTITTSFGRIYPVWRSDLVVSALRRAAPESQISVLQTSLPNAAELVPLLKELLVSEGKHFKMRVLLTNPLSAEGKAVIAARVRLRDQGARYHEREIEDHIKQFAKLKSDVDAAWSSSRDGAKLSLELRLYDHLPFGPHYHIGDNDSFIGFFISRSSSIRAPMLHLRRRHGRPFEIFRDDFEHVWRSATPHAPV